MSQAAHAAGSMATRALAVASEVKAGHEELEETVSNLQVELAGMRRVQHAQEVKVPVAVAAAAAELQERIGETFDNGHLKCNLCHVEARAETASGAHVVRQPRLGQS